MLFCTALVPLASAKITKQFGWEEPVTLQLTVDDWEIHMKFPAPHDADPRFPKELIYEIHLDDFKPHADLRTDLERKKDGGKKRNNSMHIHADDLKFYSWKWTGKKKGEIGFWLEVHEHAPCEGRDLRNAGDLHDWLVKNEKYTPPGMRKISAPPQFAKQEIVGRTWSYEYGDISISRYYRYYLGLEKNYLLRLTDTYFKLEHPNEELFAVYHDTLKRILDSIVIKKAPAWAKESR